MLERGQETTWAIAVRSIRAPEARIPAMEQDRVRLAERRVQRLVLRNSGRRLEPPTGEDLIIRSAVRIADPHSITLEDRKTAQWGHAQFHTRQPPAEISVVGQ